MSNERRQDAYRFRVEAAELARSRSHPPHVANGDEQRFAAANYAMSFTKGLAHDSTTGLIQDARSFEAFRKAIDDGFVDPFTVHVPAAGQKVRRWEAPTAGLVFDLEGPDAQAVTMPPAPPLGSDELAYEMAEVYELALLRDVPLTAFAEGTTNTAVLDAVTRLNNLDYRPDGTTGRPRKPGDGSVTAQTICRGSSPGVEIGPYLSQFMLIGNDQPGFSGVGHGMIQYGALRIDQRVPVATPQDYMVDWSNWLDAQNGADLRNNNTLFTNQPPRFIAFPRDLATYVHDDALYEAYLNACLILLSMQTPFDPGFASLSGEGELFLNSLDIPANLLAIETHRRQAGGFALWGGPHILTLVTEVATRALKAVRFQKFNVHCLLRPEALAGRIQAASAINAVYPVAGQLFSDLEASIQPTVDAVRAHNSASGSTALLPMAFQEGSPMHPSYGAGHATVAGACVTILKAFFDTGTVFVRRAAGSATIDTFQRYQGGDTSVEYVTANGSGLTAQTGNPLLTLEGELNKLAANISIGRNMAGVHYFSDYYDSIRMGEEIAIGLLEEQALGYPTDRFVLTVPTFDGGVRRIGRR